MGRPDIKSAITLAISSSMPAKSSANHLPLSFFADLRGREEGGRRQCRNGTFSINGQAAGSSNLAWRLCCATVHACLGPPLPIFPALLPCHFKRCDNYDYDYDIDD